MHALLHALFYSYMEVGTRSSQASYEGLRTVVDKIKQGNGGGASEAMRRHLVNKRDAVLERNGNSKIGGRSSQRTPP
jgi:DNA-binding GntR family transcriptional regulator